MTPFSGRWPITEDYMAMAMMVSAARKQSSPEEIAEVWKEFKPTRRTKRSAIG